MKVIPAVDIMGGQVVRLVKGDPANKVVYGSDPSEMAKKWEAAGANMIHVVDLDAAFGTGNNKEAIAKVLSSMKVPVQVAGGIRTADAAKDALEKASRVVIGTMAYSDPDSVRKLAKKYPGRVVVSIDQSGGNVMVKGWKESTNVSVKDAIVRFLGMGVEDFLLTSIDRDGTLGGPDVVTLSLAAGVDSRAKIIASGGISGVDDVVRVKSAGCVAVILGKAMYDGKVSVERAKSVA
jgi:phosphoribosylformimino-5-aminoimidazole carboxamide ribotide isomerase